MLTLSKKYSVQWENDLNNEDNEVLYNLYQPLIGSSAIGMYHTLICESKWSKRYRNSIFELNRISSLTSSSEKKLIKNLAKLTKLKLIKIYSSEKNNDYTILINKPMSSEAFLNNQMLKETLKKRIGQDFFEFVELQFKPKNVIMENNGFIEIDQELISEIDSELDFVDLDVSSETLKRTFFCESEVDFNELEKILVLNSVILEINDEFKNHIESLAMQSKINTEELSQLLIENYLKSSKTIDWVSLNHDFKANLKSNKLKSLSNEDQEMIMAMNSKEWENYYCELIGENPNDITVNSIVKLKSKYNLNDGIINCLISYSYLKNNKLFVFNYISKIAESFSKNEITTTKELYSYLKNISKQNKAAKKEYKKNIKSVIDEKHQLILDESINIEW